MLYVVTNQTNSTTDLTEWEEGVERVTAPPCPHKFVICVVVTHLLGVQTRRAELSPIRSEGGVGRLGTAPLSNNQPEVERALQQRPRTRPTDITRKQMKGERDRVNLKSKRY